MPSSRPYIPSPTQWVRDQVELYEGSGGARGTTLRDTGMPVIIVASVGAKSGATRKTPLMRVEKDGQYLLVASKGGAPEHPKWYFNLKNNPAEVTIQDGGAKFEVTVRQLQGAERDDWWTYAVSVFANYAVYQANTEREIPLLLAERKV